jgi:hypothetical protein
MVQFTTSVTEEGRAGRLIMIWEFIARDVERLGWPVSAGELQPYLGQETLTLGGGGALGKWAHCPSVRPSPTQGGSTFMEGVDASRIRSSVLKACYKANTLNGRVR